MAQHLHPSIALLLSGGVDSAVALHLLVEQGYKPHLFYIHIGADEEGYEDCSAEEDMELCSWLARKYALPLEKVSLHQEYWEYVVQYMIDTVREGRTPHPDMLCNKVIKFGYFNEKWGADFEQIATGHYASKKVIGDTHYLATAKDPLKDQTDFLAQITYLQLVKAHFPLGQLMKDEVRAIATREELINAKRKDSQGICFLGKVNYNQFLEKYLGTQEGSIVELGTGKVLGTHRGYWYHTIGQRKGLGLGGGPWFVVDKNIEENTLYVSRGYDPEEQYGNIITLTEMNFISGNPMPITAEQLDITFKVRHTPDFTNGILHRLGNGYYQVHSEELIQGIAPGQFCTLYNPEHSICYGSGLITYGARV